MMRAKLQVQSVEDQSRNSSTGDWTQQTVRMSAVTGDTVYGANGENDDNTYSRWTPTAEFSATITNPNLVGKFKVGQKFYVDFTEAPE